MRIAITGAGGQLGRALSTALSQEHDLHPAATRRFRAGTARLCRAVGRHRGGVGDPLCRIYRCGWLRARSATRLSREWAWYAICRAGLPPLGAPLIYISTNEVFDGAATTPYLEYDRPAPINAYARSKWAGEQAVRELLDRFYIVRVAWLFGGERNFVRTVLRLAAERDSIAMVEDEVGSPTYAPDAAAAIARLIELPFYGTYHLVNEGACSRFAFAAEVLRLAGREHVELKPIKLADFKRDSSVPPCTPLCNVAAAALGIQLRPWQQALAEYIREQGDRGQGNREHSPVTYRLSPIIYNLYSVT